jgi:hypothetical protein
MSTEATPQIESFDSYAIVELMGRTMLAGKVTTVNLAGRGFLRIDVPTVNGQPGFTKFQSPDSIWGLTPVDQETAERAAAGLKAKPIEIWTLHLTQRQLPDPREDDNDQDDV